MTGLTGTPQHNRLSGIKRYSKDDFDKWFADYDTLVEIPAFIDDSDVKFIFTERDPDTWVTSINNGPVVIMATSFPLNILKYFDHALSVFLNQSMLVYHILSDNAYPGGPGNEAALRRNYIEYISMVKKVIPADLFCYIRLEDGLGWEQICLFLDVPIPEDENPGHNEPARSPALSQGAVNPMVTKAMIKFATLCVPVVEVLGWV